MATPKKKKPSRSYTQTTLKILFGESRNECAEPLCSNRVIASATKKSDSAIIAEIAHIYALSVDGPRGKAGMTAKAINHHNNLILLCPTHHTVVDKQHETYPASLLQQWKEEHIRKYGDSMREDMSDIGFAELEVAAKALMTDRVVVDEEAPAPAAPMPITNKVKKNSLSQGNATSLKMGVAMSHEVKAMLRNAAQLDSAFPDRLRDGFQAKYQDFVEEGLSGDELFDALYVWSGCANRDRKRGQAGLCVLSHMFVLCEVFESE